LNVGIQENDQLAIITIPVDTLFEFNRALIQPDAETLLRQISRAIATRYPNPILKIQAHTDSIGTASYNLSLSERQAEAIKQWFYRQNKIDLSKLSSQGYGATQPVALETNIDRSDNPLGRQRNRRIEIIIQK
jgi:outer membrane protein OmpA-like peptidoglycan-associated protein